MNKSTCHPDESLDPVFSKGILISALIFVTTAANAAKQCVPCQPGKWSVSGTCDQECQAGYFCNGGSKIKCRPGQNCTAGSEQANLCQPGYKCPDGVPVRCDQGHEYQDEVGQSSCKPCSGTNMAVSADRTSCSCNKPAITQANKNAGRFATDWRCDGQTCYCKAKACEAWSSWGLYGEIIYNQCSDADKCAWVCNERVDWGWGSKASW
jgi:hypothetical protein